MTKRNYAPKPCPECKEPMKREYVEESPMHGFYHWVCENPTCNLESVVYGGKETE